MADHVSPEVDPKIWQSLLQLDRKVLAKAITYWESHLWNEVLRIAPYWLHLIKKYPMQYSPLIAFTGTPGAGKSSFLNCYGSYVFGQHPQHQLALFSVDPSSPISGGSLLGDKTRMDLLAQNQQCFIRPIPSQDSSSSISPKTLPVLKFFAHLPFQSFWLETIGVGQREQELFTVADIVILLLSPATGDELQAMKKGLLEQVDLIIVTKADGELLSAAQRTAQHYQQLVHQDGRKTPVLQWSTQEFLVKGNQLQMREIAAEIEKITHQKKTAGALKLQQQSMEELLLVPVILKQARDCLKELLQDEIQQGKIALSDLIATELNPFAVNYSKKFLA